ncbi:MAG: hypothetical protein RLY50_982 [Actinomycetota bacterium]
MNPTPPVSGPDRTVRATNYFSPRTLARMAFDRPAPDLNKMLTAWEAWEKGEELPGRVLANLKTAGLAEVLAELKAQGWTPAAK